MPGENLYPTAKAGRYMAVGGTVTLDGSNPTPVNTGLRKIVAATATIHGTATPGDDPVQVTVSWPASGGTLDIYAWATNGTDPTMVASTNNTRVIAWMAIGN